LRALRHRSTHARSGEPPEGEATVPAHIGSFLLYTLVLLVSALAAGALPLLVRWSRERLQWALSVAAGAMLGAAFVHMLPEAFRSAGLWVSGLVLAGFLVLYVLERFLTVHACEVGDCEVHVIGIKAFVGLVIHALTEGMALAASLAEPRLGLLVFLAVLLHKAPSSFSLSVILLHEGYGRAKILLMNAGFILCLPLGAALYFVAGDVLQSSSFRGAALAFSGGTFLHIALTDILPEVHRQSKSRIVPVLLVLGGVGIMVLTTLIE
jgi:zinc and cadmium transporter